MPGPETTNADSDDPSYKVVEQFNDAQRNTNPSGGRARQTHGGGGNRRRSRGPGGQGQQGGANQECNMM